MSQTGVAKNQSAAKSSAQASDRESQSSLDVKNIWQHPYVDVFKHFKVQPNADWKLNKRQGDVTEIFAKEVGRKALFLNGNISANNYVQIPHPDANLKGPLGLTGRYLYLQAKAPVSSSPFSFHIDLIMAERSHGIRISASNLYKSMSTQNGFSIQVPLNLDMNRFTVVVLDIYDILKQSKLLPNDYQIPGSYQIKSIMICACSVVRGVYTSDNLYDFVTLPPDMRFKFSFPINKWPEQFAWIELPADILPNATEADLAQQRRQQANSRAALAAQAKTDALTDKQKQQMEMEVSEMLDSKRREYLKGQSVESKPISSNAKRLQDLQDSLNIKQGINNGSDLLSGNDRFGGLNQQSMGGSAADSALTQSMPYKTGQYVGDIDKKRSPKLNLDPIMELKHVIGYSPDKCKNLKWSRVPGENVVIFSAGGTLIAMDAETSEQKRFFFGHSSAICCFDVANHGGIIVSAEEGNPIIRIWDYYTARCISMVTVPDTDERGKKLSGAAIKQWSCLAFSPDGRYFASVGKDHHSKELIVVWDISRIHRGEKPEIAAKHTSEFNILCLKFSPVDNTRLVSCGKENIRFWRIKQHQNIRGSAVVLEHHTRGTVFTSLDFEWSPRAGNYGNNPESREAEELNRVFVSSKSGVVYQVNYHTEKLEQAYRTNGTDSEGKPIAIHSLACNEAFCVTGSADKYLRVWVLDFSQFFMDMQFEGTVSAVEISPDGLRIACGTQHGSLGILDKQEFKYKMLIRSQTKAIVAMDFHLPLNLIITVSSDMTIRLFDLTTYEQTIEFLSKVDSPLCIAAHPTLNIFSCGFASGNMCIFDIEKTCVTDQMNQLKKAVKKIAYSPCGSLLVACSEDGSTSLHNANRQHLPTKMMHLEFPPKHIHIAFSPLISKQKIRVADMTDTYREDMENNMSASNFDDEEQQTEEEQTEPGVQLQTFMQAESMFAIMGEYGNNLLVYDTETILLKNQVQAGHILRSFEFNKNGTEIIMVTEDLRIKFVNLSKFEGVCYKELLTVHRGSINATDLSQNGGFMLTGGEDNMIKVWDYDAQKNMPSQFQAFIGHTYPITDVKFNPLNNNNIVSIAGDDGIYVWQFHGDTASNFFPELDEEEDAVRQVQALHEKSAMHHPTMLERMRNSVKDKKKPKLPEGSFIIPPYELAAQVENYNSELVNSLGYSTAPESELKLFYRQQQIEKNLPFNHFISMSEIRQYECKPEEPTRLGLGQIEQEVKIIDPSLVNGYDGFGGVHSNLIWNAPYGNIIYTLNNKVIKEQTKSRDQKIICESQVRISCLAQHDKYLAAGEGEPNPEGFSSIYIYEVDEKNQKLYKTIKYHMQGVQSMILTHKGILISMGVYSEPTILISDYHKGEVLAANVLQETIPNAMFLNPYLQAESDMIEFFTVGSNGDFRGWQFDLFNPEHLYYLHYPVDAVPHLKETDFTCAVAIPEFQQKKNNIMTDNNQEDALNKPFTVLIGTKDGCILMFDRDQNMPWIENGRKVQLFPQDQDSQIGNIIYQKASHSIVITDSVGNIVRYAQKQISLDIPPDAIVTKAESAITAAYMDDQNVEGIIGTSSGNIFYINLQPSEQQIIRLVTRATSAMDEVQIVQLDQNNFRSGVLQVAPNQTVFLSGCGPNSSEVKLYTKDTLDQIMSFPGTGLSPVKFICGTSKNGKNRLIGHVAGELRLIHIEFLKEHQVTKVDLEDGEQLSCGTFNQSGQNFAIGTNFGSVYLGVIKAESKTRPHVALINTLCKTTKHAVTSLQLSNFEPDGSIIVAFDNAEIKVWQSASQKKPQPRATTNKKNAKTQASEIQDACQFNIIDCFDLYENPSGLTTLTDEDAEQADLYRSQPRHCEAVLAPGSQSVDSYFSFVSILQYVYLRRFTTKQVMMRIGLQFFPTSLAVADFSLTRNTLQLSTKGSPVEFTMAVGNEEGRAVVYKIENNDKKIICRTRSGMHYGACSSLSLTYEGCTLVTASKSGELFRFCLKDAIKDLKERAD